MRILITNDDGITAPGLEVLSEIARAVGGRGPNTEYLYNTASHLDALGIPDAELHWLQDRVRQLSDNRLA